MFTDGAVRQLSGREFQSLGAATDDEISVDEIIANVTA